MVSLHQIDGFRDSRGQFSRVFCDQDWSSVMGHRQIRQINHSVTASAGTIRGLHFQTPPAAELKIVRCLRGAVFDVAVDIRRGSKSFLQAFCHTLSAGDNRQLAIPEGFAHGFQALEDNTELLYLHTQPYSPDDYGRIHYKDARLSIDWPLPAAQLSEADNKAAPLAPDFSGMTL